MKNTRIRTLTAASLVILTLFTAGCSVTNGTDDKGAVTTSDAATADITSAADTEAKEDSRLSVVFSLKGGIYDGERDLTLSLPENAPEGAYITYTDDCSEPGPSSQRYDGEITVLTSDASVIRAACFDREGGYLGYIKTSTYLKAQDGRYDTYIVSLVTEDENLYGQDGIIDNPVKSGKAWERPCHVEIFLPDGECVISQDAGIRIFGGSSRSLPQKSFRLVARKDGYYDSVKYNGKGSFEYPFFESRAVIAGEKAGQLLGKYDRLVLRNGGNDSIQATAADPDMMTLTRDAVANAFVAEAAPGVAYQASAFAVVYLNGEYYGILDMKEDINDDYIRNVYGLDKSNVTVIKSALDTTRHCGEHENGGQCRFDDVWFYYEVDDGEDTELDEYLKMCREAREALSGPASGLDAAYEKLASQLDTESFMKYCAVSMFLCNTDWPHNNVRVWRYAGDAVEANVYSDGKWRFTTRDMDFTMGRYKCLVLPEIYTQADTDTVKFTLGSFFSGAYDYRENYPDSLYLQGLLALCLHNDAFRADFKEYCKALCSGETEQKLKSIMELYSNQIKNEISYHIDRWRGTADGGYTAKVWKKNTRNMIKWASERPEYFLKQLEQIDTYFG